MQTGVPLHTSPTRKRGNAGSSLARRAGVARPSAFLLLLSLYCGGLFFLGLRAAPLYRTEGLRARVAAEMLQGGNWLIPTLYGQPLLTKPPGMYAAIALVSSPFGEVTEWTARLPSALAATLTVLLFYWTFARTLGRRAGLTAGLLLPVSMLWLDRVPSAEIDLVQLAWVSAALFCFLRALELADAGPSRMETLWWCAALLCVTGGLLTKWTAPAFFYLAVVPLLWKRGRLRLLIGRGHLLGAALAVGLCLTWAGAVVHRVGWDILRETVGREAITKLWPGQHPVPWRWHETLLYPLRLLGACLPWAPALLTLRPGFGRLWSEDGRRLLQFLHCWTWPNLLFWTLVPDHALRHGMPLVPGLAGLAAMVWIAWLDGRLPWRLSRCTPRTALITLLACWLLVKLVFVVHVMPQRMRDRQPRERGELLAARVPPGQVLYLLGVKDEGILFYYGRPATRVSDSTSLPAGSGPVYCLVTAAEWQRFPHPAEVLASLKDQQGQPLLLIQPQR